MTPLEIFAQAVGFVASGMLVGSFQFKKVKLMFLFQLLASVLFTLHFLLLGAYAGFFQNLLAILRGFCLIYRDKKWANSPITLCCLIAAYITCGILTFSNIFSIFPMLAMIVSTACMWTGDGKKIRISQIFATSPCWLIYNISVFSISGILTESFNIISAAVSYIRFAIKKRGERETERNDIK